MACRSRLSEPAGIATMLASTLAVLACDHRSAAGSDGGPVQYVVRANASPSDPALAPDQLACLRAILARRIAEESPSDGAFRLSDAHLEVTPFHDPGVVLASFVPQHVDLRTGQRALGSWRIHSIVHLAGCEERFVSSPSRDGTCRLERGQHVTCFKDLDWGAGRTRRLDALGGEVPP